MSAETSYEEIEEPASPFCALVADRQTFAIIETDYAALISCCAQELDALPAEATSALRELVAIQIEGLQIAAAQQASTETKN